MTCRESFPFQDFQNALVLCDTHSPLGAQWQQQALRIGLSCLPQTVSDHLHQEGWRPFICDSQSLTALYYFITRRHLHLLFISSLSPWKRFLLDVLCSNYLDWKPHIYVVSSLSDLQKVLASYDSGLNTSGLFAHSHVRYS